MSEPSACLVLSEARETGGTERSCHVALGVEPSSSGKAASDALNCWASSPALTCLLVCCLLYLGSPYVALADLELPTQEWVFGQGGHMCAGACEARGMRSRS